MSSGEKESLPLGKCWLLKDKVEFAMILTKYM